MKWYKNSAVDDGVIISSRVRLARNLSAYPFPSRLAPRDAIKAIEGMRAAVFAGYGMADLGLVFADLSPLTAPHLQELSERRVISPAMANKDTYRGLIYNNEENISIMLNEEDHLRIQVIFPGQELRAAYETASRIDDATAHEIEYAFDADFGFLTSCPTNTGTGMRASYMLHIPLLETTGNLKAHVEIITKAGFTIRGTHGEGSESMGAIYQVSNQVTLGKSEDEIISALKHLADQLVDKELTLRQRVMKDFEKETEDTVWRAYGILANCRKISLAEAMKHLSDIRFGACVDIIDFDIPKETILSLMTNILPHNLQRVTGKDATDVRQLDILRAEYLREKFFHS